MVENGLLARINDGGSSSPTRSRYALTKVAIEKVLQGVIADALRDSFYVLSVLKFVLLMMIPNN